MALPSQLKADGKCPGDLVHRQIKYLNNAVDADHGKLKQLIRPGRIEDAQDSLCDDQRLRGQTGLARRQPEAHVFV